MMYAPNPQPVVHTTHETLERQEPPYRPFPERKPGANGRVRSTPWSLGPWYTSPLGDSNVHSLERKVERRPANENDPAGVKHSEKKSSSTTCSSAVSAGPLTIWLSTDYGGPGQFLSELQPSSPTRSKTRRNYERADGPAAGTRRTSYDLTAHRYGSTQWSPCPA